MNRLTVRNALTEIHESWKILSPINEILLFIYDEPYMNMKVYKSVNDIDSQLVDLEIEYVEFCTNNDFGQVILFVNKSKECNKAK